MSKTYAIRQKDYLGAVYNVGYVIARSEEEAAKKALEFGANAYVVAVDGDNELADVVDDILRAKNDQVRS